MRVWTTMAAIPVGVNFRDAHGDYYANTEDGIVFSDNAAVEPFAYELWDMNFAPYTEVI